MQDFIIGASIPRILISNSCTSTLDKKGYAGAIFMDLSKAFDTINHELLIAKLHAYGVDKRSLVLIKDYLSGRKQRVKIGSTYSSWSDLKEGVPQE